MLRLIAFMLLDVCELNQQIDSISTISGIFESFRDHILKELDQIQLINAKALYPETFGLSKVLSLPLHFLPATSGNRHSTASALRVTYFVATPNLRLYRIPHVGS